VPHSCADDDGSGVNDPCRTITLAPILAFRMETRAWDLTDLYAFPKPGEGGQIDPDHERPSFRRREPAGVHHGACRFASEALYELKIDTNGDAVADIAYRVRFSSSADGPQTATVRRVEGAQAAEMG